MYVFKWNSYFFFYISWYWESQGLVSCMEAISGEEPPPSRDTPLFHPGEVCQGPTGCYLVCLENLYLSRHRRGVKGYYSALHWGGFRVWRPSLMGRHPPATPPSTSESLPISIFLYITSKLLIIMGRYCEFAIRISLGRRNTVFPIQSDWLRSAVVV